MSTFDNQSMSIGCVSKLWHLLGFLRHYLLNLSKNTYLSKAFRDDIKSFGKFTIFSYLKIGSQTPSPLNFQLPFSVDAGKEVPIHVLLGKFDINIFNGFDF